MGITNSNKVISTQQIDCDGSLKVTLALTAAPDIISNPVDIALVLDRSGSMAGTPLVNMKAGAKTFIDIIAPVHRRPAHGRDRGRQPHWDRQLCRHGHPGHPDDHLGGDAEGCGGRLVGRWEHQPRRRPLPRRPPCSPQLRQREGDRHVYRREHHKPGSPPAPVAAAARAQGIVIYCIGLVGSDGGGRKAPSTTGQRIPMPPMWRLRRTRRIWNSSLRSWRPTFQYRGHQHRDPLRS